MEPPKGLEIAPAIDWDQRKVDELFAALHGRMGKLFRVAEPIVLDEAMLAALAGALFPFLVRNPAYRKQLVEAGRVDELYRLFPDFPEQFKSDDYGQRLRDRWKGWYEDNGFTPRDASTIAGYRIDPVRLLTIAERDFLGIRNLGQVGWWAVLAWREKNKEKMELLQREGG